jgi:protein ImuB
MKSYAVLYAPEFRLQAALRHLPELAKSPVALLGNEGSDHCVSQLNAKARNSHVHVGMTPTQALARCAELQLIRPNHGHERSAQDSLLQMAETLTPFVEATAVGAITLELPAERTFTAPELIQRCVLPLGLLGLDIHVGLAMTPDLALLAARFASPVRIIDSIASFLGPLPITALEPPAELLMVLQSWGIRTVGQLVALPMAQVCERLGPESVELWERAHGGRPRPLRLSKPQEFFSEQTDLEHPVEMLEPLLFMLRRFLEQITARLEAVYLVVGKLRLVLRFEKGDPYQRIFAIPQPTLEVELLFRMLHTHLENFTSETAITGLELAAKPARANEEQFSMFEKGLRDPHRFAETLARIEALLGSDRVGSPAEVSSQHPDAFELVPYNSNVPAPSIDKELLIGVPWLRFRPPIQAKVILNDIQPAFLYSSRCTGRVKDARGPWFLNGEWWDNCSWNREEWDVSTDEGLYRLVRVEEGWFLDGIYA